MTVEAAAIGVLVSALHPERIEPDEDDKQTAIRA
jgi:hypothetical protein